MQLDYTFIDGRPWVSAMRVLVHLGGMREDHMLERLRQAVADPHTPVSALAGIAPTEWVDGAGCVHPDYLLSADGMHHMAITAGRRGPARRRFMHAVARQMALTVMPALPAPVARMTTNLPVTTTNLPVSASENATVDAGVITSLVGLFDRWRTTPEVEQAWLKAAFGWDVPVEPARAGFTAKELGDAHGLHCTVVGKLLKQHLHVPADLCWHIPTPAPIGTTHRLVMVRWYDQSLRDAADAILTAHKIEKARG